MKKRVFITALIAALVLSFSASAWAGRGGYTINGMAPAYTTVSSSPDRTGDFAQIVVRLTLKKCASADGVGDYALSADTLTWSLETLRGTLVRAKIVSVDKYEELKTVDISNMANTGEDGVAYYRAKLAGTISGDAVIRVIAAISGASMKNPSPSSAITTYSVDIKFDSTATSDTKSSPEFADDLAASSFTDDTDETHDERDPESREWNGLTMPYTMTPGTAASGVKPKITWAKPDDFKAGTEATVVATITGPVEEINAYVAAKDAVKLYGIEKSAAVDIPLTSANVKQYNIPFRVTVIDDSKNVATGEKNDDKGAETKVTLAFNGGKFSMKGFPITLSATNSNSSGKATVKAVKLNVTPNTDVPEWGVVEEKEIVSGDTTGYTTFTKIADVNTWRSNHTGTLEVDDFKYVKLPNNPVTYNTEDGELVRNEFENDYGAASVDLVLNDDDYANWAASGDIEQRGKFWYAAVPTSFTFVSSDASDTDTTTVDVFTSFDKKAKPEITATVYPNGTPESADDKGGEFGEKYILKGTAPLLIATPKAPKDGGISIDITQPSFDYLGNELRQGSVHIYGTLEKTDKETKNAIALTASNPSTKKKAALKTTVIGKTVPVFDKTTTFNFDTSVLSADTDDSIFITGIYASYYSADREKIANKRVAAPKLPKPKFKAKGSKTITYKLGLWNRDQYATAPVADGYSAYAYLRSKFTGDPREWHYMYENVGGTWSFSEFGEEFNADLAEQLAAKNMSFDAKKGSIVALSKTAKNTSPTLNEAGDYFASMDLPVTAVNSAGAAQAWAELGITGDKGKVADKSLVLNGAVKKGTVFKFKLLAGKTKAESVTAEGGAINIRSYTAAAADTTVLSDWGLELVNYDSMDILVSGERTVAAGTKLPLSFKSADVVSGNSRSAGQNESSDYRYAATEMVIKSGSKWVRSKDISCINYGLVQVTNPATLAKVIADAKSADKPDKELKTLEKGKKVNLILDNLGMVTKGKITIGLKKDITNAGDPATSTNGALPASNGAALVKAAPEAAKKAGTAGDYVPNNGAAPEADAESEAEEAVTVTIGAPRTVENLTAGQKAFLTEKGYKVIAVLPEISANADGQQDFDVELDEDAPEGAKLVYIPFPKNAQPSEDDSIADFYDADGQAIEEVPAEKDITVSPWLRETVTYEPVIAVEE